MAALLNTSIAVGQLDEHLLSVGFVWEYRATPVFLDPLPVTISRLPAPVTSQEKQLVGNAVGVDFGKNLWHHRIELGLGIRVRYDQLFYEPSGNSAVGKPTMAWTNDQLFFLTGRIPVKQNNELRVSVGVGLMNRGSDYLTSEVDSLPNGQIVVFSDTRDFHYTANFASVGYCSRSIELGALMYYCGDGESFENPSRFLLPTLYLKYWIWH